ncbi:hypothetical protein FH972_024278 [Carpinus fangiana]|uniref:CENP-V/GFA domain-containing protein n=1 Tax=Carpinus fangiana TaxID=176857 RepID=A0A5N6KYH0_9ROSI|nr:hypothetical protein FH972_024278 [Carpinus fangiana]
MNVSCQCGSVSFKTKERVPLDLYHCHCSECQKQSSSAFGTSAIFLLLPPFDAVPVQKADGLPGPPFSDLPIGVWSRSTTTGYIMDCWFCKVCGSRLAHSKRYRERAEDDGWTYCSTLSIKGGCVHGLDWTQGKHIYCESMVAHLNIPDGIPAFLQDDDGEAYVQQPKKT